MSGIVVNFKVKVDLRPGNYCATFVKVRDASS